MQSLPWFREVSPLVSAGGVLERWKAMLKKEYAGTLLVTSFDILGRTKGLHPLGYAINDLAHYQGVVGAAGRTWPRSHSHELVGYIRAYGKALNWLYDRSHRTSALKVLEAHIPGMTPGLAAKTYNVLLGSTGGFTPDAALSAAGIQTVLDLRKRYGTMNGAESDRSKFTDSTFYDRAEK